jgi:hypothetical protein
VLDILNKETAVGVLGPLALVLGYRMIKTSSIELFNRLAVFISSHLAYVRGLTQYYCFQFYENNRERVAESERAFFDELSSYSIGNKDSRKLMKNIGSGVEAFKLVADNLTDLRMVLTANFEKVEDDAITDKVYDLLEQDGHKFLTSIDIRKVEPELGVVIEHMKKSQVSR